MERRKFVQHTLAVLATTGLALPAFAQSNSGRQKGFKVKRLNSRYKEKIMLGSTPIDFKLLGADTEDRLSVFISSNNLRGFGPPLHFHYTFDEFFCVLEGDFIFQLDDKRYTFGPGDAIFVPRTVRHAFDCLNEKAGTLLVAVTPSRGMEKFFAGMATVLDAPGKPDMAALQALYESFHSEIVGPPIH